MRKLKYILCLLVVMAFVVGACGSDDKKSDEGSDTTTQSNDSVADGGTDGTTADNGTEAASECRTLKYDDAPKGGEFVDYAQLASGGDNTTFDPGAVQTLDEAQITNALFDGLTDFDFTDTCKPVLKTLSAEKYEANDDATQYVFTIKDGLKFSNDEPVLPHNFKQAWERAGSAEFASPYGYLMSYIKGGSGLLDGTVTTLDSIVADDAARTLTVTLEEPNADFPSIVSFSLFSPISDADFTSLGNAPAGWGTKGATIGNGPFKLESAEASDTGEVVLVPNPNWAGNIYGDKEVALDKLTFKITQDVESSYQAFESGEGDNATIPSGQYAAATAAYKNTVSDGVLGTYFFDLGSEDPQLSGEANTKLRQAISLAINRDEINQKVYEGTRHISTGITPPGIPGFEADLCDYCKYDPDMAKKLFDEWTAAGGALSSPLKIDYNAGGSHEGVAQIIQANLKETLGIDAELDPIQEAYFREIAKAGACHICRSGWYADYPTYGNFMVDLFAKVAIDGNNLGRFSNDKFEGLIADAQKETDDTKRGELYASAEKVLLNEVTAAIPLNWYTGDHVYRDGVVNYVLPPNGMFLWERVGKNG